MQRKKFEFIPTTFVNEDREEWKYCTLFTDTWSFEVLMSFEELKKEIDKWGIFRYKKLDEISMVEKHYWELILDLDKVQILWYKEHHIIDDLKKQRELNLDMNEDAPTS